MFYVFLLLFCACVFGLCYLVDRLITRLLHPDPSARVVRQPKRAVVLGIVIGTLGAAVFLFVDGLLGRGGGAILLLLAAVLIASYFSFHLEYDDEGFTCRGLRRTRRYTYREIRGEQAIATRSGINLMLFVADSTVELSEAMQDVRPFLSHAYYARCRQLGLDPEDVPPPAPEALVWFDPPEDAD